MVDIINTIYLEQIKYDLWTLFNNNGSDKGTKWADGSIGGHQYDYTKIINKDISVLLEVGIGVQKLCNTGNINVKCSFNGSCGSIKSWLEWLPTTQIYGFDFGKPPSELLNNERFHFIYGDQSNIVDLVKLKNEIPMCDIIIDDGSHFSNDQKLTLNVLWSKLKIGGFYIIEDCALRWGDPPYLLDYLPNNPKFYDFIGNHKQGIILQKKIEEQETIFVHIPAYRDPELVKTIDSLFNNSKYPENVYVGVCHQCKDDDLYIKDLEKYRSHTNVKILDVPYTETKGLCWARNKINTELYNNESYYLQLDSHHRFAKNWDVELINMLHNLNDPMAILTGYPYSYFPETEIENQEYAPDNNTLENIPFNFTSGDNHISIRPEHVFDVHNPIKARFVAGGFIFTFGHFVLTCPHDPNIYFSEEVPLSIRAYTHGYNLYHPHRQYVFHEYTRQNKPKVWTDIPHWNSLNPTSRERTICLLFGQKTIDLKQYGLGTIRTIEEYEHYSGIYFGKRKIHPYTLQKKQPPIYNLTNLKYIDEIEYYATVPLKKVHELLEQNSNKRIEYVDLVIISENDRETYRETITNDLNDSHYCFSFKTNQKPYKYFLIVFFIDEYHYFVYENILGTFYDEL